MEHSKQLISQRRRRWMATALAVTTIFLSACAAAPEESTDGGNEPAKVEQVEGSALPRITLTAKAAERLGIQAVPVRQERVAPNPRGTGEPVQRKVIPHAAVVYDSTGGTWTFTNPKPLVFVRQPIKVSYIHGDRAVLAAGPAPGTRVVTVGAAELYGTELGLE